jgi:uncharacterized membrane protein HdeD (DUF308 family)
VSDTTPGARRSGWSTVLGVLLLLGGVIVLANAVVATVASIYFVGWAAVFGGVVVLVQAILRWGAGSQWSMVLGGAVLVVLGVFVLRNPGIGLVSLTLLAGALFLAAGVTRIAVSGQIPEARWVLVVSGAISILLGLIVLANLMAASMMLLGIILGIQILIEGVTMLVAGPRPAPQGSRSRPTAKPA